MGSRTVGLWAGAVVGLTACASLGVSESLEAAPASYWEVSSASGKYRLTVDRVVGRLTMTERRRDRVVEHWARPLPIRSEWLTGRVADDGPYAVLRNESPADADSDFLVFLGASGEVTLRYSVSDVFGETGPPGDGRWAVSYVRQRREYVLVAETLALRVFEMPSGRSMAVPAGTQADIRRDLLTRPGALDGLSADASAALGSGSGFDVLRLPDCPVAAAPERPKVSLAGRDLQILLGGLLALAAVAGICATRSHWRATGE